MMYSAEKTGVVIVNYKNIVDTVACVESLLHLRCLPKYIIIVDNECGQRALGDLYDEVLALSARSRVPPPVVINEACSKPSFISILPLNENAGFAGGNNAGISVLLRTECTAFWILNNDTLVDVDALMELCSVSNESVRLGIVGSTVVCMESKQILQCASGGMLCRITGKTTLLLEGKNLEDALAVDAESVESKLDWVLGCSFFICREVIGVVGLLPEEYFLYYEDVAFSKKAVAAGFVLKWAQKSIVWHQEGGATGAKGGTNRAEVRRNAAIDSLTIRNRFYLMTTLNPMALPIMFLSLIGVFYNRVRRGQANRCLLLLTSAFEGALGKMGRPSCWGKAGRNNDGKY